MQSPASSSAWSSPRCCGPASISCSAGPRRTDMFRPQTLIASVILFGASAACADEPNFRNHIIPILTKAGCNSGACHGALAGKGGLKLSLRGYDPEADFFVLTRQAGARRVDRQEPAKSLMLLKPTRKLPHGGGRRFEDDSDDYKIILDWI